MTWRTQTLGEIADKVDGIIRTGPFGSQLHRSDYADEGTPVVMPQDIADDRVSTEKIARVPQNHVDRLQQHRLQPGDIVYGRRGDIGRHALITEREAGWLCGTGCLRVSIGDTVLDPRFLHYYLCDPSVVGWIYNQAVGATMPNLNTSILRSIPIQHPGLDDQRRIADILSAYDDLIENNTRRIAILEEMARAIYREWFVEFRLPGHEQMEMVESELGPVPEGWQVRALSELSALIKRGIAPRYAEDGDSIVINQRCIRDGKLTLDLARRQSKRIPDEKQVQVGDVLVNSTGVGTLGRVAQIYKHLPNCTVDTHVTILRPTPDIHHDYWGLMLMSQERTFEKLGFGSTGQTELRRDSVGEILTLNPPMDVQERFSELVKPMRLSILNLAESSDVLRETRDLLLPKLISGEIDVAQAETELESAAA